jgi:hypothetical protein
MDTAFAPASEEDQSPGPEIEFTFEELQARVAERKRQPVQKLSDLHEALADWMLVNPGGTLRDMGAHFGYSGPWLCTVINSDMFQAYFAKRRQEVGSFIAASLPKKLEAAAHIAVEKMIGVMERTEDPDLILDGFDKIMHRYGYAPNARGGGAQAALAQQGNIQNNFYLSKVEFEAARGNLLENHKADEKDSSRRSPADKFSAADEQGELLDRSDGDHNLPPPST